MEVLTTCDVPECAVVLFLVHGLLSPPISVVLVDVSGVLGGKHVKRYLNTFGVVFLIVWICVGWPTFELLFLFKIGEPRYVVYCNFGDDFASTHRSHL